MLTMVVPKCNNTVRDPLPLVGYKIGSCELNWKYLCLHTLSRDCTYRLMQGINVSQQTAVLHVFTNTVVPDLNDILSGCILDREQTHIHMPVSQTTVGSVFTNSANQSSKYFKNASVLNMYTFSFSSFLTQQYHNHMCSIYIVLGTISNTEMI